MPQPPSSIAITSPVLAELTGGVPGYNDARVSIRLWWPTPGFLVTQIAGHLHGPAAQFLAGSLRAHVAMTPALRLVGFHDWERMTDYDSDARILLTDLARELNPRSDGLHLFVKSSLVAFGVRTASVVVPHLHSYASREAFERALTSMRQTPHRT